MSDSSGQPLVARRSLADVPSGRRWHGPWSLVGVSVGVVIWALPFVMASARNQLWWWAIPVVAGLVLLPFRGVLRQVGTGLLAATILLPAVIVVLTVIGFATPR